MWSKPVIRQIRGPNSPNALALDGWFSAVPSGAFCSFVLVEHQQSSKVSIKVQEVNS
jgi:hypothetical protein